MLEEFRDSEEEGSRFLGSKSLSDIEQVDDLCEEDTTLSRTDRSLVEYASFLDHGLFEQESPKNVSERERWTCRGAR